MSKKPVFQFVIIFAVFMTACSTCRSSNKHLKVIDNVVPKRTSLMQTGSTFIKSTYSLSEASREDAVYKEVASGNIPDFLRKLARVHTYTTLKNGKKYDLTFWVSPDYVSVGSNTDYVRMPMNPITAQQIADRFGCILPTTKMVDLIYRQATKKLAPKPKPPGNQMVSSRYYFEHENLIRQQLGYKPYTGLIAGHKKDVVISNRLVTRPGRVAIYGWHRPNGKAIQPLSLVHHQHYADYSHGVRLVRDKVLLNGKVVAIADVLASPETAFLLSYEGVMTKIKYPSPYQISKRETAASLSH